MSIEFPNLGIHLSHVVRYLYIFSYPVAVYGITMALGILAGLFVASWTAKKTGQNPDDYTNIALLGIVLGLLGARTYYVIFSWDYYSNHPAEILDFRGGGLALYGSLAGAKTGDIISPETKQAGHPLVLIRTASGWDGLPDAGCLLENFGKVTQLMRDHEQVIDGVTYIQVHPTFLYESLWNLAVLIVLMWVTLRKKKRFDGEVFLLYLLLYGIGRFWIEALRTDQLLIPGTKIPVSQVLAAILAAGSLLLILILRKRKNTETP